MAELELDLRFEILMTPPAFRREPRLAARLEQVASGGRSGALSASCTRFFQVLQIHRMAVEP